jgi:hypothetical protein
MAVLHIPDVVSTDATRFVIDLRWISDAVADGLRFGRPHGAGVLPEAIPRLCHPPAQRPGKCLYLRVSARSAVQAITTGVADVSELTVRAGRAAASRAAGARVVSTIRPVDWRCSRMRPVIAAFGLVRSLPAAGRVGPGELPGR